MDIREFEKRAFAFIPELPAEMGAEEHRHLLYLTLALNGEAGEFAEKVKKMFRDSGGKMDAETRRGMLLELGDVLWNVSCLAQELGADLEGVAGMCIEKFESRKRRGTLHGSGDDR